MNYWKDKVKKWDYTDSQWNNLELRKYVDYRENAKSLKQLINEQNDTTTTSKHGIESN
jgi:hypothetical protein